MKIKSLLTMALMSLALVACSKVNKENYEALGIGMEYAEITAAIGDPESCSETLGTKSCIWGDEAKHIKATFIVDKAITFSNNGL
ncbi:MAG: hypothetical protein ACI9FJ_003349 [Alteromonadaceae bacterium]|jgi:hypothetical protein